MTPVDDFADRTSNNQPDLFARLAHLFRGLEHLPDGVHVGRRNFGGGDAELGDALQFEEGFDQGERINDAGSDENGVGVENHVRLAQDFFFYVLDHCFGLRAIHESSPEI
jgi:hypothetical protein